MLISRVKSGTKNKVQPFEYHSNGVKVKDPTILKYIQDLIIPPAYTRVTIRYNKNPRKDKVTYVGFDTKGRPQHHYAKWWIKQQKATKFCDMIEFGKAYPGIQSDIRRIIAQKKTTKTKIIALIMRVITLCSFRIGNEKYAQMYKSYGISTVEKRHVTVKGGILMFKFIGKKGVLNECTVVDPSTTREIRMLIAAKKPGDKVFEYTEEGERRLIKPTEVNKWLKSYDPTFTSKMFRIFTTNIMLINRMKDANPRQLPAAKRKKHVIQVLKEVSCVVHNTPAICKKDYSDVDIIDLYITHPQKWNVAFGNSSARIGFINFLKAKC